METFYFNDKTEKFQKERTKDCKTMVRTLKSFDKFIKDYELYRKEGNSIIDSIEWAR